MAWKQRIRFHLLLLKLSRAYARGLTTILVRASHLTLASVGLPAICKGTPLWVCLPIMFSWLPFLVILAIYCVLFTSGFRYYRVLTLLLLHYPFSSVSAVVVVLIFLYS
ncbi:hypothetical protein EDC04DRAFT_2790222 [Pisolithus marmoratus]|nr:hypothetical protein EDC04DRAFT_2790222 [Pisolithus marmoratus]